MIKNNRQLQQEVLEELKFVLSDDAAGIGVTAMDGVVQLTGHVSDDSEKSEGANAALRVDGVRGVTDEIRIEPSAEHAPDDEEIAGDALNALRWYIVVPAELAKVRVTDGWITLTGEVDFDYQKVATEDAVRNLAGVKGVTNLIFVKKTNALLQEIQTRIENVLRHAADDDADQIEVKIATGRVILCGSVSSSLERSRQKEPPDRF